VGSSVLSDKWFDLKDFYFTLHFALHTMGASQDDREVAGQVKEDPSATEAQQTPPTWGMDRPFYLSLIGKSHQVRCRLPRRA
jgi:hypothetical protein